MRKIALLLLSVSQFVAANPVTEPQVIGNWNCEIRYQSIGVRTIDNLDFQANHTVVGTGLIIFNKDFVYETKHTGVWSLNDNILSEISNDYSTIKIHPDTTMKRINQDPLFKRQEQQLYQLLSDTANDGKPVKLQIEQITPEQFYFQHIWENGETFPGVCNRVKA